MLYMTIGDKTTTHTAQRVLREDASALFLPLQVPVLTQQELDGMKEQSFGQNIAQVLNLFFGTELNGWDVELCVGRYPMKLVTLGGKIQAAELWHNMENTYDLFLQRLTAMLGSVYKQDSWCASAVRIATLFGLRGELMKQGIGIFHVACTGEDLQTVFAAWYARQMGLPIGKILCGCEEDAPLWSLLYRGIYPAAGPCTQALERLIYSALGEREFDRFQSSRAVSRNYLPEEDSQTALTDSFFAAAVGADRVPKVMNSLYRTDAYFADPALALAYSGLQDYRSRRGDNLPVLLLSEESPVKFSQQIGQATGLRPEEIKKKVIMV